MGALGGPEVRGVPLTVHQILTLASIVEKETARAEERPLIARVFLNRLRDPEGPTRGRLESDPTALYGCLASNPAPASCSEGGGRVTPALLRDATNPYNTYRHAGLPPGPIANPGEAAVRCLGPHRRLTLASLRRRDLHAVHGGLHRCPSLSIPRATGPARRPHPRCLRSPVRDGSHRALRRSGVGESVRPTSADRTDSRHAQAQTDAISRR